MFRAARRSLPGGRASATVRVDSGEYVYIGVVTDRHGRDTSDAPGAARTQPGRVA